MATDRPEQRTVNAQEIVRDVVCVGASTGGFELVMSLAGAMPANLPAGIALVLHRGQNPNSSLAALLQSRSKLRVVEPKNGEHFEHGTIYLAPAGFHMLLEHDRVWLSAGPKERHSRPAADPLFRSAAATYGPRVVGVVLSGGDQDGVAGCAAISAAGGLTLAQDPGQAVDPSMPQNTILHDHVSCVLPMAGILEAIVSLSHGRSFACSTP